MMKAPGHVVIGTAVAVSGIVWSSLWPLAVGGWTRSVLILALFALAWGVVYHAALKRRASWPRLLLVQYLSVIALLWALLAGIDGSGWSVFMGAAVYAFFATILWMLPVGMIATQLFASGSTKPSVQGAAEGIVGEPQDL